MSQPHLCSLLLAPVFGLLVGCASTRQPCLQAGECGAQHACVAGVCKRSNEAPVPVRARRILLEPSRMAVIASQCGARVDPTEIPFGRSDAGQVILLVDFTAPLSPDSDVDSAFLVLQPVPDTTPSAAPVPLSVARILTAWTAADTSWGRLPRLSPTDGAWRASTWGQRPLRIDVTSIVKRWREHRDDDHGIAVLASPQDVFGARYASGTGRGQGPVLDLYLR